MPKLRDKQRLFAERYVALGFQPAEAARQAGYSPKNADSLASHLLQKPQVRAEVDRLCEQAVQKTTVTAAEIINALSAIAFAKPSERVNNSDRIRSLELLGKSLALWKDTYQAEFVRPEISEEEIEKLRTLAREHNIQLARGA